MLALDPERLGGAYAVRDWILEEARTRRDTAFLIAGLCEHLNSAGVPVDRGALALSTLHADHTAIGRYWVKGEGSHSEKLQADRTESESYRGSPFHYVHRTRQPLLLWLPATPDDAFGVVPELKADGYVHYLCLPIFFANGDENGIAFATKHTSGFSEADLAVIGLIMPACSTVLEILGGYRNLDQLLRMYVGDEPHRAILSGVVRRGAVTRIRSAILFADMRGYTRMTSTLAPEEAVEILNVYYDCLVPPIEAAGGEVLKYLGDGLLAIFRDGTDAGASAPLALAAARRALSEIAAANRAETFGRAISMGVALHHGEAAYGNVGSGERLDFTVIGRDVNLASRMARLNKALGEPLLMSGAFAAHVPGEPEPIGQHVLEGFEEAFTLYRPRS